MNITIDYFEGEKKNKRFNLVFKDGTKLNKIRFFTTVNGQFGYMNARQKRFGRLLPDYWSNGDNIVSITEVKPPVYDPIKNAKQILNKIHHSAWDDLKLQLLDVASGKTPKDSFNFHFAGKLKFRSMKPLLTPNELNQLEYAFKNKTEFIWSKKTTSKSGRDLSISTNLCSDGIFRAWFSSEYMGCGNGDYYLLLNPTTAIYYERD